MAYKYNAIFEVQYLNSMTDNGIPNYLQASIVLGESGLIYYISLNYCLRL